MGWKEEGDFSFTYLCHRHLQGLFWPRWVCAAVQIVDFHLVGSYRTISLFSAFDMEGRKGPCSCPRQFPGAVFSLNIGDINIERGSVAEE